jgi:two-component system sensor histidine kinase PilS (NtrC family)
MIDGTAPQQAWLDLRLEPYGSDALAEGPDEFARLWRGFMTARVTLGLVLLGLQTTLYLLGQSPDPLLIVVCGAYLAATLATRVAGRPHRLRSMGPRWAASSGVDMVTFALLQYVQGQSGINYSPLLALPVLQAAVLGTMPLALGTAAGATLVLLGQASLAALRSDVDSTPMVAQSALTGAGYFVIAFLASQMSARIAHEEQRSLRSRMLARVQRKVNSLVIESMTDGVLVVDARDGVLAANPAASKLLGRTDAQAQQPFSLAQDAAWQQLARLNQHSFAGKPSSGASIVLTLPGIGLQYLHVRTRIAASDDDAQERLCVMFVQDQREAEARMRTEKLVSMGRMSAAVAHEIRNPLAAIVQANALLGEEVADPRLQSLIRMVEQNANRLGRIVDEVLNISRLTRSGDGAAPSHTRLDDTVAQVCMDWSQQSSRAGSVMTDLCAGTTVVVFDPEHLRRVLVNLLDNAQRYAGADAQSIQVSTGLGPAGQALLAVWSDGSPLEPSVERHLFEPFFSSESRSTGLGLYICRELCGGHGATIAFARTQRQRAGSRVGGNEFRVRFASPASDKMRI